MLAGTNHISLEINASSLTPRNRIWPNVYDFVPSLRAAIAFSFIMYLNTYVLQLTNTTAPIRHTS